MNEIQFKSFLEKNNFKVEELAEAVYKFENENIVGLYSFEYFLDTYPVARKLIAENKKVFNKWSQCPYQHKIDNVIKDTNQFLQNLIWLASNEGENYSDTFSYLDKNPIIPFES